MAAGQIAIPVGMGEYFLTLLEEKAKRLDADLEAARGDKNNLDLCIQMGRAQGANSNRIAVLEAAIRDARERK